MSKTDKAKQKTIPPRSQPGVGNPTYTEAWALVESAKSLAAPLEKNSFDDPETREQIREALRLNWKLWTIFQAELGVEKEDGLPVEMRSDMLNLCNFIDKHTVDSISDPTPEKISTLIDINCQLANGLIATIE